MANVFVCHRGADTVEAERLGEELRRRGHVVRLDAWEVGVGDSVIAWMNEGVSDSAYLMLCYSDAGVMAPWISREWMSTLARQLDGANVKILPARLTGGEPPAILADIVYADLVNNWALGVAALCKAIL